MRQHGLRRTYVLQYSLVEQKSKRLKLETPAASIVSLMYGEGDFKKTVQIAVLAGWDSDNPAATWGGLLGGLGTTTVLAVVLAGCTWSSRWIPPMWTTSKPRIFPI